MWVWICSHQNRKVNYVIDKTVIRLDAKNTTPKCEQDNENDTSHCLTTAKANFTREIIDLKEKERGEKNLGGILNTTVGDSERMNGPIQVEIFLGLSERQTLSQCCLVNLDDSNTSLLEILNLVLNG